MSLLNRKSGGKAPEALEDWRKHEGLVQAQNRRKEIASLLATYTDVDLVRAEAAVAEAEKQQSDLEIQVLSGREPESRLAQAQAGLLAAKRQRALVLVKVGDLTDQDRQLEAAIPDLEFQAKDTAVRQLRRAYKAQLLALKEALSQVMPIQFEMARLCTIGNNSLPHDFHGHHDTRFPVRAGLVPVSVTKRSIEPGFNGYYMGSHAVSPDQAAAEYLREINEALETLEKGGFM